MAANPSAPQRMALGSVPVEMRAGLRMLACEARLLVACDYDGTLAPIVDDPEQAYPLPEAVAALRGLAGAADTTVAVISGRSLRDLAALSRLPAEVRLVGSHGSEFDIGFVRSLGPRASHLLARVREEAESLVSACPGAAIEIKPASVAIHVRGAQRDKARWVVDRAVHGPGGRAGVHVTQGDMVVELAVVATDKGAALDRLRHEVGATAALYLGDGVADEQVFARLTGPDVGVKVGAGASDSRFRVAGPESVSAVLAYLVEERRAWLSGADAPPIQRLSMLGNGQSVALLTPDARVTWLCHPQPDSGAVFADLLGGPSAGHFSVAPAHGGLPLGQAYVPGTMTVRTRWAGLTVTDYLADDVPRHRTTLVRVIEGDGAVHLSFAPRPEFGVVPTWLTASAGGVGLVVSGADEPMVLRSPGVEWAITEDGQHQTAHATVHLVAGEALVLELRCGTGDVSEHCYEVGRRRRAESRSSRWLDSLSLPAVKTALVGRAALTLRALCYEPTGAILAAATTSLPEEMGGVRNWDYRYCWLRDAALTARVLVDLGSMREARSYLRWLHSVVAATDHPERLHPLYTLNGDTLHAEAVLESLPGYAGSRPVRIGNLASHQVQLDVFGPIVDLVLVVADATGVLDDEDWSLVRAMVDAVERRWQEPDHGIWEQRQAPRHHVYTKTMCWQAVDRAMTLAAGHHRMPGASWPALRDRIADDVVTFGARGRGGAFTAAYDDSDLDAASLHVGLSGLLDTADPRFRATVAAVEAELRCGSTVYRYRADDGLPGHEGGFHLCTTWLVEAYLSVGRTADAEDLFEQFVATAGPTGLLAEEYCPVTERSLGNHPQAYSHLGLIRCARLLATAQNVDGGRTPSTERAALPA